MVNDSTVEKLGEILNQNPNGITHKRDEIYGFLQTLDREGHDSRPFLFDYLTLTVYVLQRYATPCDEGTWEPFLGVGLLAVSVCLFCLATRCEDELRVLAAAFRVCHQCCSLSRNFPSPASQLKIQAMYVAGISLARWPRYFPNGITGVQAICKSSHAFE